MAIKHYWQAVLVMLLVSLPGLLLAEQAKIVEIQTATANSGERIVFTLNTVSKPHIFSLSHPDRVVLDFTNTKLAVNLQKIIFKNPHIKGLRSGYPKANILRIVVDLNASTHYQEISPPQGNPIILDLTFAHTAPAIAITTTLKPKAKPVKLPVVEPPKIRIMTVAIDPGHGGKDPGAIGEYGAEEKNIVLAVAKDLAELINRQPQMHAVLTRDSDRFVTLRERLKLARKDKADIFISIHADSYLKDNSSGVSVYALSRHGATSEAGRWLAKRENYSELGGVDLGELGDKSNLLRSVMIDLAQTATITDSLHLGKAMLDSLDDMAKLHYKTVEQAPFVVLKSPDIPSVLVEIGFISNGQEELRLKNPVYQHRIAQALFKGIETYIKKYSVTGI